MTVRIINADVLAGLAQLPDESVHCVVTSPPYWGLRDYGVEGQIGLEATPQAFVARMVEVFREVRRVLRKDGTCWVNMGDSYSGSGKGGNPEGNETKQNSNKGSLMASQYGKTGDTARQAAVTNVSRRLCAEARMKPKDLCGVPWRLAFALQDDGWWLRQDIIWAKPNPMPESVTDRCTKAHEYIFLLTKAERYFYDADAIKEDRVSVNGAWVNGWASGDTPHTAVAHSRDKGNAKTFRGGGKYTNGQEKTPDPVARRASHGNAPAQIELRNKRSVWSIATDPFPEAHFATFPPELPEICIKAGCPVGGTVLDPFSGAGTTALVADRLQRNAIGIELNPVYAAMSEKRIAGDRGGLLDLMEAAE